MVLSFGGLPFGPGRLGTTFLPLIVLSFLTRGGGSEAQCVVTLLAPLAVLG